MALSDFADTTQLNSTSSCRHVHSVNSCHLSMNVVTQLTQFVGHDVINKNTTDLAVRCTSGSVELSWVELCRYKHPFRLWVRRTGCQNPHPPSPFIIITQPGKLMLILLSTEGRRLSRPSWLLTYRLHIYMVTYLWRWCILLRALNFTAIFCTMFSGNLCSNFVTKFRGFQVIVHVILKDVWKSRMQWRMQKFR